MLKRLVDRIRSPRGQTILEFAFVAPFLIVFLLTIVDFSIAIDRRLVLQHGVREGARYGAVHTNAADIAQYTVDQSQDIIGVGDVDICYIDGDDANATPGNAGDAVQVSGDFTWDFPVATEILGAFGVPPLSINMTPSGTARLENSVGGAVACP